MAKTIPRALRRQAKGKAEVETRAFANPGAWLSPQSQAGIYVTPESALNFSAVFAAINVISTDIASLPCITYEKQANGAKVPDPSHPNYDLLAVEANGEVDAFHLTQTIFGHALGHGNGYAEILRRGDGQAAKLFNIDPRECEPVRDRKGRLLYELSNGKHLLPENVLHLKGLTHDGIKGISVVTKARQSIGLGIAAELFGASYFGNNAVTSGFWKTKKKVDPITQESMRDEIEGVHGGPYRAHKIGFLTGDWEWIQNSLSPEDSQFLATREFSIIEMCRWFNINPIKLMDYTNGNYSNVEQSHLDYITTTLLPWLVNWESELNRKLLTRQDRAKFVIKHDLSARLRGDSKARMDYYKGGFSIGMFSQNAMLRMEDLNPIQDGDTHYIPGNNMVASGTAAAAPIAADLPDAGGTAGWVESPKPRTQDGGRKSRSATREELVDLALESLVPAA